MREEKAMADPVGDIIGDYRARVRQALAHHLGLDIPAIGDGVR
jgi:hypothetical protein